MAQRLDTTKLTTMSKYKAKKTVIDGITFDSKKEANRYVELKQMELNGEISNLQLQVPYELIPKQVIDGKVVERACKYLADFQYNKEGETIVEDTKGMRLSDYIIKRKLMLHKYNIRIVEI